MNKDIRLPLTQAEYARGEKGTKCPFCFSSNIKGGNVAIHVGEAHQTIRCKDCKQEWLDFYELVAYQPMIEV
jgi:transposase-like protein